MMSTTRLLFFPIITGAFVIGAAPVTEQQALLSALEHRYEVRILHLETQSDSLKTETEKAPWLPQLSVKTQLSAIPFDSTSVTHNGNALSYLSGSSSSLKNDNSISVSQHLPGGGTIGGSVSLDNTVDLEHTDSTTRATALQLEVTQPLLRNAWWADPVATDITLARLDHERFTCAQQQRMLSYGSDIRTRFWNLYEAQALVDLYKQETAYAKEQFATERTRVALGMAPPIDTLSAKLTYINSTARLHDALSDLLQLQEELAFYSGINDSAITIDSTIVIAVPPLPPPDTMIAMAERFDPQLRIFSVAAKRLALQRRLTRNSLLPNVALKGSLQRSTDEKSSTRTNYFVNNSVISLIASYDLPTRPRKIALQRNAIDADINKLNRENHREQLRLRIAELHRSWERERRAIEIAESAQNVARQALTAAREGFSVGTVDRLSLVKAENDYRSACSELLRKQLLMKQLEIVFDEITGVTLTRLGVQLQ